MVPDSCVSNSGQWNVSGSTCATSEFCPQRRRNTHSPLPFYFPVDWNKNEMVAASGNHCGSTRWKLDSAFCNKTEETRHSHDPLGHLPSFVYEREIPFYLFKVTVILAFSVISLNLSNMKIVGPHH